MRTLAMIAATMLATACGKQQPTVDEQRAATLQRLAELEAKADEQDMRDAPFNSKLDLDQLTEVQRMELCGPDWRYVAIGWPMKKALACVGREMTVVSVSSGYRVWQGCSMGNCITIGEVAGRVSTASKN